MFSLTSRSIRLESQRRGKVPRIPVNTKSWFNSIRKKNFEDTVFPITSASITVFNEGLFRLVYLPRGERRVQIFLAACREIHQNYKRGYRSFQLTAILRDWRPAYSSAFQS